MTEILIFVTAVTAVTVAFASIIIANNDKLNKFAPAITLGAGIFVGLISVPLTNLGVIDRLYGGFIAGLVAAGALNLDAIKTIFKSKGGK